MNPTNSCPAPQLLESLLKGELDPQHAAQLRSHLTVCGLCSLLAHRLEAFHTIAEAPTLPHSADWDRLQPRIDKRFHQHLQNPQAPPAHSWSDILSWLSHPALAWCAVLVLAYPAWLGIRRPAPAGNAPTQARRAAAPAQFLDLNAVRGGGTSAPPTTILRPESRLILTFFAAVQPGHSYFVDLSEQSGASVLQDVPIAPNDDKGNFFLDCDSALLPPGRYTLTLNSPAAEPRHFQFIIR